MGNKNDARNMNELKKRINNFLNGKKIRGGERTFKCSALESHFLINNFKGSGKKDLRIVGYLSKAQITKIRIKCSTYGLEDGYNLLKEMNEFAGDIKKGDCNLNLKDWLNEGIKDLEEFLEKYNT